MHLQLQLIDVDGGSVIKTFDLPMPILESLAEDNDILARYIGWDPVQGMLGSSTLPETLMTGDPEDAWTPAGKLDVCLVAHVDDRENPGFLEYMTYEERKSKGITR